MRFFRSKMGMTGLLLLLSLNSACRDRDTAPVVERQAVTVAFKMPVAVGKIPVSSLSPSGTKALERQEKKKNVSVTPVAVTTGALSLKDAAVIETEAYTGEGKVDPFVPLIKNEPVRVQAPERPLTPLERLDYSQMRLVAIVGRGADYVAMVEESGGKGYIVKIGTYMGRNGGVVSEIRKDRIIVSERVKDFKGDMITRTQEMKLNKTEDKEV